MSEASAASIVHLILTLVFAFGSSAGICPLILLFVGTAVTALADNPSMGSLAWQLHQASRNNTGWLDAACIVCLFQACYVM